MLKKSGKESMTKLIWIYMMIAVSGALTIAANF